MYCRGSTYKTEFRTRNYGVIYLPPGCSVDAEAFTLSSSDAAYTREEEAWGFSASFNVSLDFFAEGINTTAFSALINDSQKTAEESQKVSFDQAKQMLHAASQSPTLPFSWHIPLAAGLPSLTTLAMLALAIHAIYLHSRLSSSANSSSTTPAIAHIITSNAVLANPTLSQTSIKPSLFD